MSRKIVTLLTLSVAVASFTVATFVHVVKAPKAVVFDAMGHPTLGDGAIEIVIFEDFRCSGCHLFSVEIFPKILEKYVDTGRARCIIVPLAFLEGSNLLAGAALNVYDQAPDRFLPFIRELFDSDIEKKKDIVNVAKKIGGIDLGLLVKSLDAHAYYDALDRNLQWAERLMGREFGTPALFVEGVAVSPFSLEQIQRAVERMERRI